MFSHLYPFLNADDGTVAGAETPDTNVTPDGEQGAGDEQPSVKMFTQEQVEELIRARLEREQAQRKKAEEKVRREAEEQAAKEQGEWKKLAETNAARISELEPAAEQGERYKTALTGYLDREREGLPAHITALLDKLDPVEQLEWISENRELIEQPARSGNGIPKTPRPASAATQKEQVEENVSLLKRSGIYPI